MLCHVRIAGGEESLAEVVAELSRRDLERLLGLAVVELMEALFEDHLAGPCNIRALGTDSAVWCRAGQRAARLDQPS